MICEFCGGEVIWKDTDSHYRPYTECQLCKRINCQDKFKIPPWIEDGMDTRTGQYFNDTRTGQEKDMIVKVESEIQTYDEPATPNVKVHAHWCYRDRVVLEVGDRKVTVLAKDLKAAVDNATNTAAP